MREQNIQDIIDKLNRAKIIFLKLITANDVGTTDAHQAGFHLPKSSWKLVRISSTQSFILYLSLR